MINDVSVLVDQVRSLYNVGSIFRVADAVGANKIYLSGYSGVEIINGKPQLHRKINKTGLEGINTPWEYVEDPAKYIAQLKASKVNIYALEITSDSEIYNKVEYRFPLCLIVGHERRGVDNNLLKLADKTIRIPMYGKGKSLNVAVATAVALYQIINNE